VRYPQWLLLLIAILGILSGGRSARALERLARCHDQAFGAALNLELPNAPFYLLKEDLPPRLLRVDLLVIAEPQLK
jgi:hypothetical protein